MDAICIKSLYHNGWDLQYLVLWYIVYYCVMRITEYYKITKNVRIIIFVVIWIIFFGVLDEIRAEQSLSFLKGILLSELKEKWKNIVIPQIWSFLISIDIVFLAIKQLDITHNAHQIVYNTVQMFIKWPIALGVIVSCYFVSKKTNMRWFIFVGSISYELYLVYEYVQKFMDNVGNTLEFVWGWGVLFWPISFGIAILYHYIIKWSRPILNKLFLLEK